MSIPSLAGFPALIRRTGVLVAATAILAFTAGPLVAQAEKGTDPILAKVNGAEIHESDLALIEEEAGQLPPMAAEAKRDYLINFAADMMLLAQAAEKQKVDGTDLFKRRLAMLREKLLMETLLQSTGKQALTDEAMHKVYDEAVKQMKPEEEVHARHILIRVAAGDEKASKQAEDKIKAIIARLKKGEDFAKVASETTEDPSGKANGGDLGYFTKEQMVPEFAEVAFKLDKGQISDPVKTQFGWHVIKVEDKRTKPTPTFDEVKPQIENYVTRKAQADLVTKLRAEGKVERLDKPADAAKPAPPAPEKK